MEIVKKSSTIGLQLKCRQLFDYKIVKDQWPNIYMH